MIKIKRGSSTSWQKLKKPLADGQPGYDKTTRKLKIGDGVSLWKDLRDVSGFSAEEIFESESKADDETIFTFGTDMPNSNTKGKIYLQQFDGGVEADYVVETGRNEKYYYRKWESGFIECWGNGEIPSSVSNLVKIRIFQVSSTTYFEIKGFWK